MGTVLFSQAPRAQIFHPSPSCTAALSIIFPEAAVPSNPNELLGQIFNNNQPPRHGRFHLFWHNPHISRLVRDHMERSPLNLVELLG